MVECLEDNMWYVFGLLGVGIVCFICGGILGVVKAKGIVMAAVNRVDLVQLFPSYINVPLERWIKKVIRYAVEQEDFSA
jgi:hypothetical protein